MNWGIQDNPWYYASVLLFAVSLWLVRDLRDANQRKNHLADLCKKLLTKP